MSSPLVRVVPVVLFGVGAVALAWGAASFHGAAEGTSSGPPTAPAERRGAEDAGGGATIDAPTAREEIAPAAPDTSNVARVEDGEIVEAPTGEDYRCLTPRLEVPRDLACDHDAPYPDCRWQLPDDESSRRWYRVWRNTTPEHRWAQPGLVSLVMAAAREHTLRWPGHHVTIGDLDAPGPRHQTHDLGHDVDLYLEHAMLDSNIGGGRYIATYEGRPSRVVALLRAEVLDLARILATCARGHIRIYYNDPEIIVPFLSWFDGHGMVSDVGPAMVEHNRLHRFHFHMTIADGMAPLPIATE